MAQAWVPTIRRRLMLTILDIIARVTRLGRAPASPAKSRDDVRRILVVEPKNIGDVVLTLPFLAQLRKVFPNSRTTMLANPFARILLDGSDLVDDYIDSNLGWTEEATRYNPLAYNWRELWRLKGALPRRRFDLVFKCCMHIREHIVIGLSGGDRRIAYAFGMGDRVLTDPIATDDPNRHKSADWLRLLDSFGSAGQVDVPRLRLFESERQWAERYLRERGIPEDTRIVGVHPGASVPEKRWPLDRFYEVAKVLAAREGIRVLAFIDPQGYGASLVDIEGVVGVKVGLRELIALIQRCDLLVCNDSGPMHIAGALGVRTVAIFGSGINLWFAPLGAGHHLITRGNATGGESIAPYDVAEIPTSRVLAEIRSALGDFSGSADPEPGQLQNNASD
jgi:heptosyltransferase II